MARRPGKVLQRGDVGDISEYNPCNQPPWPSETRLALAGLLN